MKNEIRQGNYVSITPFKNETDIVQLNEEEIEYLYIFKNWDRIKPIPLTEEFKKEFGENKNVLVDKLGFVIFKNTYAYQFVFEDYPFIHSIQNLYFALTNEELKNNL